MCGTKFDGSIPCWTSREQIVQMYSNWDHDRDEVCPICEGTEYVCSEGWPMPVPCPCRKPDRWFPPVVEEFYDELFFACHDGEEEEESSPTPDDLAHIRKLKDMIRKAKSPGERRKLRKALQEEWDALQ
jgi:hypothetical protein